MAPVAMITAWARSRTIFPSPRRSTISPSGVIIDTVVSWRREMPEAALNAAASSAPRRLSGPNVAATGEASTLR